MGHIWFSDIDSRLLKAFKLGRPQSGCFFSFPQKFGPVQARPTAVHAFRHAALRRPLA
jgi:hypothetical protein